MTSLCSLKPSDEDPLLTDHKANSAANSADRDNTQYSAESIEHYEAVFGQDFVSPGGREMAIELITSLNLQPGSRVLDVGCGLGGCAFAMATDFGLVVDGIDLSKNMIDRANKKCKKYGLGKKVNLNLGNCLELKASPTYHGIFSRDVFLHIHDKKRLFSNLKNALLPGGKLLFTDYCCGEKPWSDEFSEYVSNRNYQLHTVTEYTQILEEAGFQVIDARDATGRFIDILKTELKKIAALEFSPSEKTLLADSWQSKIDRARQGDHRWGIFQAQL